MVVTIEKFKTNRKWRFLWLQYINGVNLSHHCQRCLLGKTSKKIKTDTKSAENVILDELDSRYYYLCGVAPSMDLPDNFHLAFEESEGEIIEYSFNGIDVRIKNAKRVEFSADDINWDVEHSEEELYHRCRNWQFAHKVSNGGEITKFKLSFENEFILQKITEKNLDLFDLEFVASEFQYKKLRIDTLAFNKKNNSFVIIEYKNKFNANVLNQVKGYYDLLLENKVIFIDKFNISADFDKIQALIIGPTFSKKQIDEAKPPFGLWQVSLYDNNKIVYKQLKTGETKTLKVCDEELTLTENDLLNNKSEELCELYDVLKNRIDAEFSDVESKILVDAFSYKINNNLICVIRFLKNYFKIYFYAQNLSDSENLLTDISNTKTAANANYEFKLNPDDDLDYFMDLFKQTYNQRCED